MTNTEQDFEPDVQQFVYFPVQSLVTHKSAVSHKQAIQSPPLKYIPADKPVVPRSKQRHIKQQSVVLEPSILVSNFDFKINFQSGCMGEVTELKSNTYFIKVKTETNSKKPCQWFYFSCTGINFGTFIISGLTKEKSLFNEGMKVAVCEEGGQWKRGGELISYSQELDQNDESNATYRLKFTYSFKNPGALTYFALTFPYTYTTLNNFLDEIVKKHNNLCELQVLSKTYLQNNLYCLTIGNHNALQTIVISARVHPGQTVSSFIIQGFIQFLLQNHSYSKFLRNTYLFKILPMLNPDGVTSGHYRLSYTGRDLNRMWQAPTKFSPEIFNLKRYLINLNKNRKIMMLIDIHGHSRQKNAFFYGCSSKSKTTNQRMFRQFPYLMSQIDSSYKYENCSFKMSRGKKGTMRLTMYEELQIPWIYTLECSLCGDLGKEKNYSIQDLYRLGRKLVEGIAIYLPKSQSHYGSIVTQLQVKRKNLLSSFKQLPEEDSLNDSDSNPSEGCLDDKELDDLLSAKEKTNTASSAIQKRKKLLEFRSKLEKKKQQSTIQTCANPNADSIDKKDIRIRWNRLKSSVAIRRSEQPQYATILKVKQARLMRTGLSIQLQSPRSRTKETIHRSIPRPIFPGALKKFPKSQQLSSEKSRKFMVGPELGCRKIEY